MNDDKESFRIFEEQLKTLESRLEEELKKHETQGKIIEDLTAQLEKDQKEEVYSEKIQAEVDKLRQNFSKECDDILQKLNCVYSKDLQDVWARRAVTLSALGIIWTGALERFEVEGINQSILAKTIEFTDPAAIWNRIESSRRAVMIDWLQNYEFSPNVKPEALISANIWGFLLREILLSMEGIPTQHSRENRLQCFPEFSTKHVTSIGTLFYADFAFTCGCSGLPLFLCELAASSEDLHKDLKKLAVQMAGVLFNLIERIRENREANAVNFLAKLRVFGALVSGSSIEFVVSRPVFGEDGKFMIIFESQSDWAFDVIQSIGVVNEGSVQALACFIHEIHKYYSSLPDVVKDLHVNPKGSRIDGNAFTLAYPESIHETCMTRLLRQQSSIEIVDAIASKSCPSYSCHLTLPQIAHSEPCSVKSYRRDWYYGGKSLPEIEHEIHQQEMDLVNNRVYFRSILILDITMAMYKAYEHGIVFEKFELSDIIFKDSVFRIRTYGNAEKAENGFESLKSSVKCFENFYFETYLMDSIFTEWESDYRLLKQVEALVFRSFREFDPENGEEFDFVALFLRASVIFQNVLEQCSIKSDKNMTHFLLERIFLRGSLSSNSKSSSMKRMSIPQEKLEDFRTSASNSATVEVELEELDGLETLEELIKLKK